MQLQNKLSSSSHYEQLIGKFESDWAKPALHPQSLKDSV